MLCTMQGPATQPPIQQPRPPQPGPVQQHQQQHQQLPRSGSGGPRFWHCPRCRITNSFERRECNQCGLTSTEGAVVSIAKITTGRVSPSIVMPGCTGSKQTEPFSVHERRYASSLQRLSGQGTT